MGGHCMRVPAECEIVGLGVFQVRSTSKLFNQSQPTLDAHQDLRSKSGNDRGQIATCHVAASK
jgi:hypothetical protein